MNDDTKWKIPEKFRIEAGVTSEHAARLLEASDAAQKELSATVGLPFQGVTPLTRAMSKARATVELLDARKDLSPEQREQLAEALATLGRYDLAANRSKVNKALYRKYWKAVFLPDSQWCEHDEKHKYVKEFVFSIREGREMPLLACGVCRTWNVLDDPDRAETEHRRAHMGAQTKGFSIKDALRWHHDNLPRK